MMTIRSTVAGAAAAVALVLCQGCAPNPGAEAGLLVGLSSGRTLWIAPEGGAARLVATLPHLLVPRPDGFWWVGTEQRCTLEELNGQGMGLTEAGVFLDRDEALYTVRAGDTARVALDGISCDEAEREAARRRPVFLRALADSAAAAGDSSALLELRADSSGAEGGGVDDCSRTTRQVTFVSPTVLSVMERYATTEFCSPAKYETSGSNSVTRFGSEEQIPLRPLLPPAQAAAVSKEFGGFDGCSFRADEDSTADSAAYVDNAWAALRDQGRWVASIWVNGPTACRGGTDIEQTIPLPLSLTGDAPLPIAWPEIARRVPGLADAAGSPSGGRLVLIAGDTLSLVRVRGGTVGDAELTVPVGYGERFVMLRWASADEAARWNRAIPALAAPVVRVQAPAPR